MVPPGQIGTIPQSFDKYIQQSVSQLSCLGSSLHSPPPSDFPSLRKTPSDRGTLMDLAARSMSRASIPDTRRHRPRLRLETPVSNIRQCQISQPPLPAETHYLEAPNRHSM